MVTQVASSFRDPSGHLFQKDKLLYRTINQCYQKQYDHLMNSGLYKRLTEKNLLVPHTEIANVPELESNTYKVITPEIIPFISYPYEWSFSQIKDAALLTLEIQEIALSYGMTLKDASIYNVQFKDGKPIFIDTLSFDIYQQGTPWDAYKQFCQHFLAPLALMHYTDIRLNQLLRIYIDGIPLDLASSLLPKKTYFKLSLLLHIHFHAKGQDKYQNSQRKDIEKKQITPTQTKGLIDNLKSGIRKLRWNATGTEWVDYYDGDSYTQNAFDHKKELVEHFLVQTHQKIVWDLGGNDGMFSRIASKHAESVISFDIDPACIENNYIQAKKNNEQRLLPLRLDLSNPSPAIGWNNTERLNLSKRGPADMILSLALIHHLAISNNVPFHYLAQYFSQLGNWLIIEFVPKKDKKVQKLLQTRKDIFAQYTQEDFEREFEYFFTIEEKTLIKESLRTLYLMKNKRV